MIRIILEDQNNKEIAQSSASGNECLLWQKDAEHFPLLSSLDECSCDAFSAADMDGLIEELTEVSKEAKDPDMRKHLDELCRLAGRCKENFGWTLIFTPFPE